MNKSAIKIAITVIIAILKNFKDYSNLFIGYEVKPRRSNVSLGLPPVFLL